MKRRDFIKGAAAGGALLFIPGISACTPQDFSLERALSVIESLKHSRSLRSRGPQSAFQILMHCTQSVDCALVGYPEMKPEWFQNSIGKAAFHAFSLMDQMKHDRTAPIPGMPVPAKDGDVQLALQELEAAFLKLKGIPAVYPHFFFGALSHREMERIQVLHLMNHLELLEWKKA
ncbi:MAG TPA: DUF1569 domain-containing protein [Oligoflexus sp.]|uniref:DUF1569 domain-containing protein n=1 Tax=Oligoflexus sp. TaxID=1971216 RepID=UPI002D7E7172|nr:DUF1569 domain-containing protein [Oligoflexus sp.]HET9236363.1 DUF1569 domain-containing protein [Oligoflexus sp.]